MEHSKNYSKVKLWYRMKMWNETKVRNAVKMGWITKEVYGFANGMSKLITSLGKGSDGIGKSLNELGGKIGGTRILIRFLH